MKTIITTDNVSISFLASLFSLQAPDGVAEIGILPVGGKRVKYVSLDDLDVEDPRIVEGKESEVFPVNDKRERLEWKTSEVKKPSAKKAAKKPVKEAAPAKTPVEPVKPAKAKEDPKEKPAKAPKPKAEPRQHTGFVAKVRAMLADGGDTHSKHSIQDMCDVVLEDFPDKDPRSVKRIGYNLARLTGRKWRVLAQNTGYLNRIDELLFAGELTTRLIGEMVAVEYDKDVHSAKSVVRARMQVLKGLGHKLTIPLEDTESRQTTFLPAVG